VDLLGGPSRSRSFATSLTLDAQTVEHEAATAEFADVAGLQDHVGQQLAAYVVGLRDPKGRRQVASRWPAPRDR
jgi:hypothetical protein